MSTAKRSTFRRKNRSRRPRRLQVEQLEHRLVMSGMPVTEALAVAVTAEQTMADVPMLIAPVTNESGADTTRTFDTGFERYNSLEEIKNYMLAEAIKQNRDTFGTEIFWHKRNNYDLDTGIGIIDIGFRMFGGEMLGVGAMTLATASNSYSDTNTQVAGVDEADLMETDGNYLYMLSRGELVIIDVRSVDKPTIASRMRLDRSVASMYLAGDRLTLISQPNYGYAAIGLASIDYTPSTPNFEVTVLDIADRTAPKVAQRTFLEGSLIDSRAIGDRVYLVINDGKSLPGPVIVNMDGSYLKSNTYDPDARYRYETEQEYRQRMGEYMEKFVLPRFASYDGEGKEIASGFISDPTKIYKPDESGSWGALTTVAVIDMTSNVPGPVDAISLMGRSDTQVYVSQENLYLIGFYGWPEKTLIRKIDLVGDGGKLEFVAKGTVDGSVLDQFSVDEYEGFLRIATTEGWGSTSDNHLFVLKQSGKDLKIIGSVDGLAPGERIYSARFMGDQAYVVTFRQIDPLFAIDLSDPTAPVVKGELEIPGFSNYLQSVEGGLLIGLGRNGGFSEPQISLFDVGDMSNPQLIDRITIPTGYFWGGIFDDHHVVAYYPESDILTVSVPDVNDEAETNYWNYDENDLYVFRIDTSEASAGLEMLGKIEHNDSVTRSVRIEDRLISISNESIEVHELTNPDVVTATLLLNENSGIQPIVLPPVVSPPIVQPPVIPQPNPWNRFLVIEPIIMVPGEILVIDPVITVPGKRVPIAPENVPEAQRPDTYPAVPLASNVGEKVNSDQRLIYGLIGKVFGDHATVDSLYASGFNDIVTLDSRLEIELRSVDRAFQPRSLTIKTVDNHVNYKQYESFFENISRVEATAILTEFADGKKRHNDEAGIDTLSWDVVEGMLVYPHVANSKIVL